jgi:hypothetical protein
MIGDVAQPKGDAVLFKDMSHSNAERGPWNWMSVSMESI